MGKGIKKSMRRTVTTTNKNEWPEEARAFNKRISERRAAGFIPDLRRAVKCDYFYKSFWRDPHFIKLYLGSNVAIYLQWLQKHGGEHLKILDVGCGAGYISLELARAGHRVTGIDIASQAIKAAKETLAANPFKKNFGSLEYKATTLEKINGSYDVVLFSGVLHHLDNVEDALRQSIKLLKPKGLLLCGEPLHDRWRLADAVQVVLIRGLLSLTGGWYEKSLGTSLAKSEENIFQYAKDVHVEYVTERDKEETGGQSPHDNSTAGTVILKNLRKNFRQLEYQNGPSFIYRLLGGLRGSDKKTHQLADFIAFYEKLAVRKGYLRPNGFFFIGRKKKK